MTSGLSEDQLNQFRADGYLVVTDVLDHASVIEPVLDEFEHLIEALERITFGEECGRVERLGSRLARLWQSAGASRCIAWFDITLPKTIVTHQTPFNPRPAVFDLLVNDRLLDVVASCVGPEIYSNPTQHFRMKFPVRPPDGLQTSGLIHAVPWHQDNGVLLPEADDSAIVTVWIPLTEATEENGCMRVLPRIHAELIDHCPQLDGGLGIPDQLLPLTEAVALPMEPGSVLLMTQRTPHSSLPNTTATDVRLSLDLRYQATGEPTGRPAFDPAGFIARSATDPSSALRNSDEWRDRWLHLRDDLAGTTVPTFYRWAGDAAACA